MNIYYDCEFLEGTQDKRIFGIKTGRKTKPTIDLISIGMVRDDGQEYYAISKDFNIWEAWNRYDIKTEQVHGDMRNIFPEGKKVKVYWIRENVLKPTWIHLVNEHNRKVTKLSLTINHKDEKKFTFKNFKKLLLKYGKSNEEIKKEVHYFCINEFVVNNKDQRPIELYGYYSAYDHVVLCWLFGKMIDLPSGFPMYTKDLKQIIDEKAENMLKGYLDQGITVEKNHRRPLNTDMMIRMIKKNPSYPKNKNEHSAIADSRWNKELHEFLKSI